MPVRNLPHTSQQEGDFLRDIIAQARVVVWRADARTLRCSYVSPEATVLLGYPASRWTDEPDFWISAIHADDRRWVLEECGRATAMLQPHELEYRMVATGGRIVWVRDLVRVLHQGGVATELVGAIFDMTERHAAYEALIQSRELLRAILDHSPTIVFVKSLDGRYLEVNQAYEKLLQRPRAAVIGRTDAEVYPAEIADQFRANDLKVIAAGRPLEFEEFTAFAGGARTSLALKFPIADASGRLYATGGIVTDFTERKLASEALKSLNTQLEARVVERTAELRSANEELEAFTSSVSHDLRAPVRAIEGFTEMLIAELGPKLEEPSSRLLQRVRGAALRMGQLIDGLLALSRASRVPLTRVKVDLGDIARQVGLELMSHLPRREVNLRIEGDLSARGDPVLMRQALENLLGNAWKYTSNLPVANIEFGVSDRGGVREFYVRDDGAGFDMTYVGKLFKPFERLHSESEFPGAGVGLATVHRIIERHGGAMRAEGVPGKGATFYFTLPT
jgi:PAS domain S-box-containing protein